MKLPGKFLATTALSLICLASVRSSSGQYAVLHSFSVTDGSTPQGKLVMDAGGNLFGTTSAGGSNGGGTVFELSPVSGGSFIGGFSRQNSVTISLDSTGRALYKSVVPRPGQYAVSATYNGASSFVNSGPVSITGVVVTH